MDKKRRLKISFPSPLEYIEDIFDDNIDVFVELDNGSYTVEVATPNNLLTLMDRHGMDFLEPGCPFLIVRMLKQEIIEEAISAHAEEDNAYWLKLHHFSGSIKDEMFNKLQEEEDREYESLRKDIDESI